jgi:hypothetical protein
MAITRGNSVTFNATVPTKTAREIRRVARLVGVSEATFTAMALAMGTRAIERHFAPEHFMPEQVWDALARAGVEVAREQAAEQDAKV